MRLSSTIAVASIGSLAYLPAVYGWGAAGHEIVATIAQMYLHPNVLPTLCDILEMPTSRCHLASVATWADQHRNQMRWSAPLHYIGALDDHPSDTCAFPGPRRWAGSPGINVLDGIQNTTSLLQAWVDEDATDAVANEALKFLIHFVGDMHQPLHLTGRDRGGNSVKVLFGRRHTNLHSLWDSFLIAQSLRNVPGNYSRPLPYPKVEKALRGTIYDSYIRRILWEGILNPWEDDLDSWLDCASPEAPTVEASGLLGMWQSAYELTSKLVRILARDGVEINPDGPVVCPHFWAQPIHMLNCDIIWPKALDEPPYNVRFESDSYEHHHHDEDEESEASTLNVPLLNLDTPEYAGVIAEEMIIEKLLAQGGIRLAGVLNYIFANGEDPEGAQGAFLANFRA
ncbi:phospholipase C/P1 nuclease domain-containing protein [Gymnopilus junonius]|uniref:Phospholipase C/P1 nuclease domain-containing protein n=1 Tax=Gymnopilus junonius TaxID=109634 RepID=A0A9P5NBM6_GYMJU|nr:phospholipase C/P1 nuclease domain-containing protein [Gymnopilus junonius]